MGKESAGSTVRRHPLYRPWLTAFWWLLSPCWPSPPLLEKEAKERMAAGGGDKSKEAGVVNLPYPLGTARDLAGAKLAV